MFGYHTKAARASDVKPRTVFSVVLCKNLSVWDKKSFHTRMFPHENEKVLVCSFIGFHFHLVINHLRSPPPTSLQSSV